MVSTIKGFPFQMRPATNVTPFTYRDGAQFLEILNALERHIRDDITPWYQAELQRVIDETVTAVNNAGEHVTDSEAAIAELVANAIKYVNDSVQNINNRTGPAEVQRISLTGNYTLKIDPLWPSRHPVYVMLTQDAAGGRTVALSPNIAGALDLDSAPGSVTEFWLIPAGDVWHIFQPASRIPGSPADLAVAGLLQDTRSAVFKRVTEMIANA